MSENVKNVNSDFSFIDINSIQAEKITAPRYSYWASVFRVFFRKKINILLICLFILLIAGSFIIPMLIPYNPYENVTDAKTYNLSPAAAMNYFGGFSFKWLFGTGTQGNSIFAGIWASARTSLLLAVICAAINMSIGIIIGAFWGYSKKADQILLVIYNIIANVPYILLISVLVYIIGSGFWSFVFALTVTGWLGIAYFFRTQVMIIRDREYNLASRCLGTPTWKIITHNILPYLVSVIMTSISRDVPSFISYEVFLSFIGVGLGQQYASLGRMIQQYSPYMTSTPYLFWIPVAISALISVSLYIVGQTLADASDPRTHMI